MLEVYHCGDIFGVQEQNLLRSIPCIFYECFMELQNGRLQTNVSSTEMDQPLPRENKPNQGADFMELDGSSPSGHFEDFGAREMVLELIPQVQQALEVINHAWAMSNTVRANKRQCKRLANRLHAIGEGFKSVLGWDKNFNGGNSSDSSGRNHYPALDELLTVLRKGEALISSYVDSKSISILVGRTDNRESFKEIHEELDTLKAQFDFESYSERGSVKDFEASSGGQRTQALTEDANLDLKTMPADMAQIQDSEHITEMEMEKVNEVVLEKSLVSDSSDEVLNSIRIDLAAIKIEKPVRPVVLNSMHDNADELGWAVVRFGKYMGLDFAVKVFKSAATDGAGWNNKQLLMEVGSLEKMRHPHIVKLVFFGRDAEQCVFLMELMDTDLRNFMNEMKPSIEQKPRPFTHPEELDIITQIAKGMLYMHTQQYLHADLKCSNILVKKSGDHLDVKISDLRGSQKLGKVWDKEGFEQARRSRPRWTAPEVIKLYEGLEPPSDDLLKKSDVYSFGMTCYEVVTGKHPFDGIKKDELMKQIHAGQRPELPADLDEDLQGLIRQCWDPEPNKRPGFRQICYLLDFIRSKKPFVVSNKFSGQDMLLSVWKWIVPQGEEAILNDRPVMGGGGIQRSKSALSVPEHLRIQQDELKLVKPIGTGGSATVYKATWLGCTFAAKVFKKSKFPEIEVLQTEVDFLIKLSRYPLIAMMVGLCVDENQQCSIVMELMDGNLRDLIESRMKNIRLVRLLKQREVGPFRLHEALSIIYKIALGMAFLHSKNVMHRDLKSGNVLAKEHAQGIDVKLVDFGVSINEDKSEGREGRYSGTGTGFWRAPELLPKGADLKEPDNDKKLDLRAADVYSFAMTSYEVLTGNEPFSDLGRTEYARVIGGYRPTLPDQLHKVLKELIQKCWHGNPVKRPKFTEICEELKKIQEALPSSIS